MLNSEERAIYAKACLFELLNAVGSSYDPATDFVKLVDEALERARSLAGGRGFDLTYAEIMEALRVNKPAQHAMTVELLVERFLESEERR